MELILIPFFWSVLFVRMFFDHFFYLIFPTTILTLQGHYIVTFLGLLCHSVEKYMYVYCLCWFRVCTSLSIQIYLTHSVDYVSLGCHLLSRVFYSVHLFVRLTKVRISLIFISVKSDVCRI